MTSFVSSAYVLSVSLIATALLKLFAPSGSTGKILKRIISIFVIICIVLCVGSVIKQISADTQNNPNDISSEEMSKAIDKNVLESTADYMADYIFGLLSENGIPLSSAEVTLKLGEDNVINISNVCIYIDKPQNADINQISDIISNNLGISPEISVKEEQ